MSNCPVIFGSNPNVLTLIPSFNSANASGLKTNCCFCFNSSGTGTGSGFASFLAFFISSGNVATFAITSIKPLLNFSATSLAVSPSLSAASACLAVASLYALTFGSSSETPPRIRSIASSSVMPPKDGTVSCPSNP